MNWKKLLLFLVPIFLITMLLVVVYAYKEYNRKLTALSESKADFVIGGRMMLDEFLKDDSIAISNYLGKIVSVKGRVKSWERGSKGESCIIVLGDSNTTDAVRCSMDSTQCRDKVNTQPEIRIKGVCIGYNRDDLLGFDLLLNRCVIEK